MHERVNSFTLRGALESIVCYSHTFGNNLGRKRKFTKYLKESCCLASDQHFSFNCFFWKCFSKWNISKIVRPVLAALSVNELKWKPFVGFLCFHPKGITKIISTFMNTTSMTLLNPSDILHYVAFVQFLHKRMV